MGKYGRLKILNIYVDIQAVDSKNDVLIVYDNQMVWVNKDVEYIEIGDQIFGKHKTVIGIFYSSIDAALYVDFYDDCMTLNEYLKKPQFKRISKIKKMLC